MEIKCPDNNSSVYFEEAKCLSPTQCFKAFPMVSHCFLSYFPTWCPVDMLAYNSHHFRTTSINSICVELIVLEAGILMHPIIKGGKKLTLLPCQLSLKFCIIYSQKNLSHFRGFTIRMCAFTICESFEINTFEQCNYYVQSDLAFIEMGKD